MRMFNNFKDRVKITLSIIFAKKTHKEEKRELKIKSSIDAPERPEFSIWFTYLDRLLS